MSTSWRVWTEKLLRHKPPSISTKVGISALYVISDFYLVWENGDKARIKGLCIPSLRDIRSTPSECRRKIMNQLLPKDLTFKEVTSKFADETVSPLVLPNKDEVEPSENLTLRVDEVVTTGPSKPHKPVKQKPEQLGRTTPRHKPKVYKMEWKRLILYNVKRDCFRRFDVRPLTRARPALKDLPRLEESLRARVIVDRSFGGRNTPDSWPGSFRTSKETCFISILILNVHGLRQNDQSKLFLAGPREGTFKKNGTPVTMLVLSQALIKFLREKTNKATWSHVVIGGDLNMNESGLEDLPNPIMKTMLSRTIRWPSVDHIAVKGFSEIPSVWPLQNWAISDHFPVYAKVNFEVIIVHDEKWNAVMMKADGSLSILVDEFINSVWEVARGCDTVRVYANKTCKVNVSRETRKFIATKRDMFKSISEPDFDVSVRKTQAIAKIVVENRHKDLWMEINNCESNGLSDKPVLDESKGTVVHDKKDKEQLWAKHFGLDGVPVDVLKVIAMEKCLVSPSAQALWLTANVGVVVPFPKKVMTIAIEKIAYERVNTISEENGLLAKEQKIDILYEIEKRRSIRDQATFIAFIDCAKAYDKVPQGALLRRLKSIRITGHLLKVIKLLYEDPRMCIRVGSSLSPVFNYYCEMRQVPGFDNTIILACSKGEMQRSLDLLSCAIIEISSDQTIQKKQDDPSSYLVMGKSVPIVNEYVYLGVRFTPDLFLISMMKHCESTGRKALGAMYYLLTNKTMPVFVKSLAIKAKQQPIITYGAEVWVLVLKGIKIGDETNSIRARDFSCQARWAGCETWMADLSSSTSVSRQWTRVNENIKCLKRYAGWNPGQAMTKELFDEVFSLREQDDKTKIGSWAKEYELATKPVWIRLGIRYPGLQRGCLGRANTIGTFNLVLNLSTYFSSVGDKNSIGSITFRGGLLGLAKAPNVTYREAS
ncbi:hypothetical protein P3W45_001780, partial [Vairimorpha bombi]